MIDAANGERVMIVGGRAIAVELARTFGMSGWDVGLVMDSLDATTAMEHLARTSAKGGGSVVHIEADTPERGAVQRAYERVRHTLGEPSIVVACLCDTRSGESSVQLRGRFAVAALDDAIDEVLLPFFESWHAAAPAMVERGWGRLIAVCSLLGKGPYAALGAPSQVAVHAAAIGMVKAVAKELASTGVTANCVATLGLERVAAWPGAEQPATGVTPPLGRLAAPFEVADAVAFLASRSASYVTGETINLDGGLMME